MSEVEKSEAEVIQDGVEERLKTEKAIMTEQQFTLGGYLDLFKKLSKDVRNKELRNSDTFIAWLRHTNGGTSPVHVVDTQDHDKELFIVPPLMTSEGVDTNKILYQLEDMGIGSIADIGQRLNTFSNAGLAGKAEVYLNRISQIINMNVDSNRPESNRLWIEIFRRYAHGYHPVTGRALQEGEPIDGSGSSSKSETTSTTSNPTTKPKKSLRIDDSDIEDLW